MLDGRVPSLRGEGEFCFSITSLGYRGQLEEITCHNQLDASERTTIAPETSGNCF